MVLPHEPLPVEMSDAAVAALDAAIAEELAALSADEQLDPIAEDGSGRPALPFDSAESAFRLLCTGPKPLAVSGRRIGHGLPGRSIRLTELTAILMHPSCSFGARDAAWRLLVAKARSGDPAWVVGAVGVASPGLRSAAARLAGANDADVQAEVLTGFLAALRRLDLAAPRVCSRLCNAAQVTARAVLRVEASASAVDAVSAPAAPGGHPDFVLARAVRAGVLSAADAELIGATRLEEVPVADYAARVGLTRWAAYKRRSVAERRLVEALADGALTDPVAEVVAEATGDVVPDWPAHRFSRPAD